MSDETRGCQCNECKAGLHSSADLLAENERLRAELEIGDAALLRAIGAQQLRTDLNTMREAMEAHARRADAAEAENERLRAELAELKRDVAHGYWEGVRADNERLKADLAASREQTAAVLVEVSKLKDQLGELGEELEVTDIQRHRAVIKAGEQEMRALGAEALRKEERVRAESAERERDEARARLAEECAANNQLEQRWQRVWRESQQAAEREVTKLRARADKLWNLVEQALDWTSMPWPEHAARVRRNLAAMSSPTTPAGEVEGNRKVTREEAAGEAKKINWPGGIHPYNAVALGHRDSAPASPIEAPGKRCPLCGKPLLGQVSDDETTTSWNCSCGYAAARMRVDAPTIPTSEKGE